MTANLGKVLFIDDTYDATIKGAVTSLVELGVPVQFWNGKNSFPKGISNVRIVIIDLDLAGVGERSGTEIDYYPAAEALTKIPGPSVVIIMARDYGDDDPTNLRRYYANNYGQFHGIILDNGLKKYDELEDPSKLPKLLTASISAEETLKLLMLWEDVIDKAQDKAFKQLISKQIKTTISNLVKSLCRDFGEESAARELVKTVMQLILRRMYEPEEFKELESLIKKFNSANTQDNTTYPSDEDLLLYNQIMFYKPNDGEPIWTGDIYCIEGFPKYFCHAIVLNPVCDFTNKKPSKIIMCLGFVINEEAFKDTEYPPYFCDPGIAKKLLEKEEPDTIITSLKKRYMLGTEQHGENLYSLWNVEIEGKAKGICFDFNNTITIDHDELIRKKWKRLQRLDEPFCQQILEKYGRFISRVGIPEINLSPEQLKDKLKKQIKKENAKAQAK